METDPFPAIVPWEEPVEGARLLDELCDFIRQYLVLPDHAAEVIALFVLHTYLVDAAEYTPYLLVTSPVRECGKSTLLELLEHLVHRAEATGGITASALYKVVDALSPTMLIDEVDTRLRGEGGESLRGVLDTGFKRTGKTTISVAGKRGFRKFSTFSPKVLAGIGRVWDTVASRSIPIRLERATAEQLATLTRIRGDRIGGICLPLRRKLRRFADDALAAVRDTDAETPSELGARESDVWRPLLAIATVTGGHWTVTATAAARAIHRQAEEDGDTGVQLLDDLRALFAERNNPESLHTKLIVQSLVARDDRSWAEYGKARGVTPRGVWLLLAPFDVKPMPSRVGGVQARGYYLADLQPAFQRYLGAPESTVTAVTEGAVTGVTVEKGTPMPAPLDQPGEASARAA